MSSKNIESAWRTTGLIPYNPSTVLEKLAAKRKQVSSSLVTTPERQSSIMVLQTPANVAQVGQIDNFIF